MMSRDKNRFSKAVNAQIAWHWLPVTVAGAALLFLIIGFLDRFWWVFELFANFRPQYAIVALLSALSLSFRKKFRKFALFAYSVSAVIFISILPIYFAPSVNIDTTSPESLRVMQINVFTANGEYKKVEDAILKYDPDILLLDEVNRQWLDNMSMIREKYPYSLEEPREDNFGIAMFAKIKPEKCEIRMSSAAMVPYVYAQFLIGDARRSVVFFGVHTLPPIGKEYFDGRNAMLHEIAEDIKREKTSDIIMAGDLNITLWSSHFKDFLASSNLRNSQYGFGIQPTWPDKLFFLLIPIDHCLVSSKIKVVKRQVGGNVGSDHYPLIVDLEL